ncbi:DUF1643 domain-containing protein [Halobacillus shinanisalinarum]|uniref:DUF1643 domain-containing protein n=1 Tax=Halobacillus shinanisalinarum TaxID=2932258 RepID=A0ABY4GW07_9BACI|nr:DUF1643 domain-containing protein [Halobacillus shinanisalinarum]UOQ92303.1 DUF1643 domain-containing protein [Halobacillus shinanisalinarum]
MKASYRNWREDEQVRVIFDRTSTYRYLLECTFDESKNKITFVMLNPSAANSDICDTTLNRCVNYTRSWGYGGMYIVNLYALVSTNPKRLLTHRDPIGVENDHYILDAAEKSETTVLAWGEKYASIRNRKAEVLEMLKGYDLHCIKKTKNGKHPRHPLFLKKDLNPIPF